MKTALPSDCGNSPRVTIVGEFVLSWARGDTDAVAEWLAEDASWSLIGGDTQHGPDAATAVGPPLSPELVEVHSIVTHGRHAACDGYLEAGGTRISFSHMFRFTGAAKTAKIAAIRTYSVETGHR